MSSFHLELAALDKAAAEDDKTPDIPPRYGKLAFLMARDQTTAMTWNSMDYMRGHWAEMATKQTDAERMAFAALCKANYRS